MDVDVADALAMQDMAVDELQNLIGASERSGRQVLQQLENGSSIAQAATGNLPHDERVHQGRGPLQQVHEPGVTPTQVVNPDRGVDQDQVEFPARRRWAASSEGCVPPSRARRLALSRSINAFKASLRRAVLSMGLTNLLAFSSNSSSMWTVVRTFPPWGVASNMASTDPRSPTCPRL